MSSGLKDDAKVSLFQSRSELGLEIEGLGLSQRAKAF